MRTDSFDYELPHDLIAQRPAPRGHARLLVVHRSSGALEHRRFADLDEYLLPGDLLILNNTRVSARRLGAMRENGLPAEVLLLRRTGDGLWEALTRPGRSLRVGARLALQGPGGLAASAEVVDVLPDGGRLLRVEEGSAGDLQSWGEAPLPPYIHHALSIQEEELYQTVYGRIAGSAAAPTAGLHLSTAHLDRMGRRGIGRVEVTLHIGVDTFRPVRTSMVENHQMHGEEVEIAADVAEAVNRASGRIVAIGTTSVRALESAASIARYPARAEAFRGETRLFLYPGRPVRAVDALVTNLHLPKSTLLMLVSALAGKELILEAYRAAVARRYRFFSFGDAMLIL